MKNIYCDFETQSTVDLKKEGAKVYLQHPHTRVMSGVFMVNGKIHTWVPANTKSPYTEPGLITSDKFPEQFLQLAKKGYTFVAHNAELFDEWLIKTKYPEAKDTKWIDTIHYCRAAGLPGALGKVLPIVCGVEKTDNTAMLMLCQAKIIKGKPIYPVGNKALWEKMIKYNVDDVKHLEKLTMYLASTGVFSLREPEFIDQHCKRNSHGFSIDIPLVRKLRRLWEKLQEKAVDEVAEITDGALTERDLFSPQKVKSYLRSIGYKHDTLNAQTVNQILAKPEDFLEGDTAESILAIISIRKNAIRSTIGKLDRVLAEVDDDGRVRKSIIYHGAHTGRPTGRGVNPLNFPRGAKIDGGKLYCNLQQMDKPHLGILQHPKENEGDVLSTATRYIIKPTNGGTFSIADLNAIECRLTGWYADCKGLLGAFSDPKRDVYCEMASKLYGKTVTPKDELERFIGKQIILGCGYGMGAAKFELMCKIYRVSLTKAGVTAKQCVDAYRTAYPEVKRYWHRLEDNCKHAVEMQGTEFSAGRVGFFCSGGWLEITLASGRKLRYREASVDRIPAPWDDRQIIDQVQYTTQHGYRASLYGGKILENVCQATCRDLLYNSLTMLQHARMDIYDEIVAEDPLPDLLKAMSTLPKWAKGLPIKVQGFTAPCYTKEKFS